MNESDYYNSNNPYNSVSGADAVQLDSEIQLAEGQQRGMTGQALVVGVLMIIQGVMNLVASAGAGFYAWFFPQIFEEMQKQGAANQPPMPPEAMSFITIGGGIVSAVMFLIGLLLIYSGIGVTRYKGRGLAAFTLGLGILTLFTCYCFPTSLALGIYGFIFLLNQPVAVAFELRSQGYSVRRIQQAFLSLPS